MLSNDCPSHVAGKLVNRSVASPYQNPVLGLVVCATAAAVELAIPKSSQGSGSGVPSALFAWKSSARTSQLLLILLSPRIGVDPIN